MSTLVMTRKGDGEVAKLDGARLPWANRAPNSKNHGAQQWFHGVRNPVRTRLGVEVKKTIRLGKS